MRKGIQADRRTGVDPDCPPSSLSAFPPSKATGPDRKAFERAIRELEEMDPRVMLRPGICPIPADLFQRVTEQAEREIEEQRREFDEWLRFMISVRWFEDGFPPGDVY